MGSTVGSSAGVGMDNARRWLTQVIGRGEPDPVEEPTSPPAAGEPSTFREFYLPDGRRAVALGSPIPTREAMGRSQADPLSTLGRRDGRGKPYSWSSGSGRFVEQAHGLVDLDAQPAEHRSFQAYMPTYEGMNVAQRRWYFWWRREYRAGRQLSTDHAYVLVHAFELINLVGVRDGAEAFDALSALEAAYGRIYPWMLHDLERWIEDLALVHGLDDRLVARWNAKIGDWTSRNVSMRLLERHIGDGFLRMPMPVIGALAKYDISSTFARAGNQHLFELFVRLGLDGVDAAFRKRTGAGLVERFAPSRSSSATWRPHAFYGAVYAGVQVELDPVADHRYAEQLADRLHGVVKYTDLRLRDETAFKHRLRSVKITKTDAKIVDRLIAEQLPAYLQRFGPAQTGAKVAVAVPAPSRSG